MSGILNLDWTSFAPAIGAVALSVRNWLVMRRGANITPLPFINFGLWSIKRDTISNKVLVLPIMFDNSGVGNGLVTDITIAFSSDGKEFVPIQLRRKILLEKLSEQEIRNMDLTMFRNKVIKSINPTYPISVLAKESTSELFECFDGDNAIKMDVEQTCMITIVQGNGRVKSKNFSFKLSQEQFDEAINNLTWI